MLNLESIRVLKPGGTFGLTTWAYDGAFYFLQHAQTLVLDAPNTRARETVAMSDANGYWRGRTFI